MRRPNQPLPRQFTLRYDLTVYSGRTDLLLEKFNVRPPTLAVMSGTSLIVAATKSFY